MRATGNRTRTNKKNKIIAAALIAAAIVLPLSGCGSGNSASLIVMGSSSMQPYVEILAEEYAHIYGERDVDVLAGGSSAGIMAVESGIADVGMSSRALKPAEQYLWSTVMAKDGLAIVTHPENPVRNLTVEQVRDIYAGTLINWSDVGGADAKIHVITREEGSGSRDAFESLVMDKRPITPRAIVQDSNGAVKQLVSSDVNSIGFISSGLVDDKVNAIILDGVAATHENISIGAYPLFREFLFVTEGEPGEYAAKFIDYALSPAGQAILDTEGLVTR